MPQKILKALSTPVESRRFLLPSKLQPFVYSLMISDEDRRKIIKGFNLLLQDGRMTNLIDYIDGLGIRRKDDDLPTLQSIRSEILKDPSIEAIGWNLSKNPKYKKWKIDEWLSIHPVVEKISLLFIGATFALLANLYISRQSKQAQRLKDTQQDSLIKAVNDSISNVQKHITDSAIHK